MCSGNSIGSRTSLKCPPDICLFDLLFKLLAAISRGESFSAGITELVVSITADVWSAGCKMAIPSPPFVEVTLGS